MITFKAIKPATTFRSSIFRETLREAAVVIAPKMAADMKRPTKTWQEPVEFTTEVTVGANAGGRAAKKTSAGASGIAISVTTEDKRYLFVDEGTRVRYATMSPDFQAKTKVNSLIARRGRGRMLFVNKRRPRPGIKARNFTKLVHKKWQPEFRAAMDRALFEAAIKSKYNVR